VTRLSPRDAEAWSNLGNVLREMRRYDEAAAACRRAIEAQPTMAAAHNNLGTVFEKLNDVDQAVMAYLRAVELDPRYAAALTNLVNSIIDLKGVGRVTDAVDASRAALELRPDCAELHHILGSCLEHDGLDDEAIGEYRIAAALKPGFADAQSSLCYVHAWRGLGTPADYLVCAREWERACVPVAARQAAQQRVFGNPPMSARRLKVGFVSGDFRKHATSFFLEHLLSNFDRKRVALLAR
jgi:protein O-GlcNAc transferase